MDYRLPNRIQNSNKSTYGRVLNIAGSDYMPGAAYLSSAAALKIGCGYCYLATCEKVIPSVSAQNPNIVFVPLDKIENYLDLADVVSIGCGLTQNDCAIDLFNKVINSLSPKTPLIIDADGLNILAKNSKNFLDRKFKNVILTPHPKEAARLLNCSLDNVLFNIEFSAKEISKIYNCITVLKKHNTLIYSPDGKSYTNDTGNSALSKAGSGDVLTGMIAGIKAQGAYLFESAVLGVYLHGLSAEFASKKLTQYCVLGQDLIDYIPDAVKSLH